MNYDEEINKMLRTRRRAIWFFASCFILAPLFMLAVNGVETFIQSIILNLIVSPIAIQSMANLNYEIKQWKLMQLDHKGIQ